MTSDVARRSYGAFGRLGPGSRFAGYLIEEQVGAGGMAVVFRARDEALGRLAAVKVITPSMADDDEFRARFLRESRAAAAVDSPYIVPVYGAGEADGLLYIATRFIAGGDLAGLARREGGRLGTERTASLVSQVASALDSAHAAGLVHRDVKPQNILIDARERAYLSDFGLSKGTESTGLTATGQFVGTPDFSAPEQIRGGRLDGRADQYSLACVAFTLLTGSVPFRRDGAVPTLFAHLRDPVPRLTALRQDLPAAVDVVIARALAKSPGERYRTCAEFAAALRAALAGDDTQTLRTARRERDSTGTLSRSHAHGRRRAAATWAAGAAAAVLAVVVTAAVILHVPSPGHGAGSPTASAPASGSAKPGSASAVTSRMLIGGDYGFHAVGGIAADGAHIWVANTSSVTELNASDGSLVRTVSGRGYGFSTSIDITDDGTHLWVINGLGSAVTELNASDGSLVRTLSGAGCLFSVAVDGPDVWGASCGSLVEWNLSDGRLVRTLKLDVNGAAIAADGAHIWVADDNSVKELNASDGSLVRTLSGGEYGFHDPGGIAVDGADIWVASSGSVTELKASDGSLVRTISGAKYAFGGSSQIVPDGAHLWVADANAVTELNASDGSLVRTLSGGYYGFYQPSIAVNGDHVWVANIGTNSVTELTIG